MSNGGVLFRTNCSQCHNVAGAGGALTDGKYAPSLRDTSPKHIYEAMLTGPQNMPIFNDNVMSPQDKKDIIAYLLHTRDQAPTPAVWTWARSARSPRACSSGRSCSAC